MGLLRRFAPRNDGRARNDGNSCNDELGGILEFKDEYDRDWEI